LLLKLRGRPIVPGQAKGRALVSMKPLSFLGGVDPETGIIIEREHDLEGMSIKDVILCFPHGHGSTVGSYVLYSLAKKGLGPKAIINIDADPVIVVGAVISEIPMIDRVDISRIKTGDWAEVDGDLGVVRIIKGE